MERDNSRREFLKIAGTGLAGLLLGAGCETYTDEKGIEDVYNVSPEKAGQIMPGRVSLVYALDTSSSMNDRVDKTTKIRGLKEAVIKSLEICRDYQQKGRVIEVGAFYLTGQTTIRELWSLQNLDYGDMAEKVGELTAQGGTPLGILLARSQRALNQRATGKRSIILFTDGESNEGRNPDEVLKNINETNRQTNNPKTSVYVIPFDMPKGISANLANVGAVIKKAKDLKELEEAFRITTEKIMLEAPIPEGKGYEMLNK